MTQQEIERRRKMFHWYINGINVHCIPWSLYDLLTPDWVTEHYNIEL